MQVEQLTGPLTHHGEGPVWDARLQRLILVDMVGGDVLSLDPGGALVDRRHVGPLAACVVPRRGGGHAVAGERGFLLLDDDGEVEDLGPAWDDPAIRMNDGACDPLGRFFCGSMAFDAAPGRGVLWRLDPDRSLHRVLDGVTISNGLGWSTDGRTAFFIDSPTQCVDAFTFDEGGLRDRRPFVEVPVEAGLPDGLAVDADGGVWVALWRGGAVHRYGPDGHLDEVVALPVRQPTSCAFGGDGLAVLYITTSSYQCAEASAGAVFTLRPGVVGAPTWAFDG